MQTWKGSNVKLPVRLTEKQFEAWEILHDDVTEELIFGGGAGGGKSRLGCDWLIKQARTLPNTRWLMGRETLVDLKETTLVTFFEAANEMKLKAGKDYIYQENKKRIKFPKTNSYVILYELGWYPKDPNYDRFGSLEITGAFIDEIGQLRYKAVQTLKTRIRWKLRENNLIPKLLGSLNPTKGWAYSEFYIPWKENRQEKHRKFIQSLVGDNPYIPESYVESLRKLDDKAQKERLLHGNWEYDDDPTSLFPIDVIDNLFTNRGTAGKKYLVGDVSRQGRDTMPIGYWNGLRCEKIREIPQDIRASTKDSAQFIMDWADELEIPYSNIILDEDGVGGGVVDQIPGCKGFINNSAPVPEKRDAPKPNYANLKSQCWKLCSDKAAEGAIGIIADPEQKQTIQKELEQIKRVHADKDKKYQVIGKDKIKEAIGRSPDYADMIMMRMRFELPFDTKEKFIAAPLMVAIPSR